MSAPRWPLRQSATLSAASSTLRSMWAAVFRGTSVCSRRRRSSKISRVVPRWLYSHWIDGERRTPSPLKGGEGLGIYGIIAAVLIFSVGFARADNAPTRADIWSLKLGAPASALPQDAFVDYACGSNGGPPQQALTGWSDYDKCPPEPSGLREVYFRYDDELEYRAKAHRARTLVAQYAGTKVLDFPVIVSGLFNTGGTLAGLRIVTDPQIGPQDRKQAYTLSHFFKARYGSDGWDCIDNPAAPGETPVGTL